MLRSVSLSIVCIAAAAASFGGRASLSAQGPAAPLAAAADQTFARDGVSLRYRDVGSGEPVILIHGYSAALESMLGVATPLSASYRTIALDLRGFGKSSKFAEPARFGQHMVDDVVGLMDHLKIQRAHLVGHSMGALIAANIVSRYPARVISATLIAGPFYPDKPTFTKEVTPWVNDLENGRGLANFIQWLFPKLDPKMAMGISAQAMKTNDLASLIAVMRSLPELAVAGLAPAVPALVTVGTGDPLHSLAGPFVKGSTNATLLSIDGADHVGIAGHADVARAIRELLQRTSAATQQIRDAA
jgi:3-oxoadipate enol-lactonase